MKQKILLLLVGTAVVSTLSWAQKTKQVTAFAITGVQKGNHNWTEVRLIDVATGQEVKTIYQSTQQPEILNARTGKAIVKNEDVNVSTTANEARTRTIQVTRRDPDNNFIIVEKKEVRITPTRAVDMNKPFSTNSAACAYDKKHERLYYTPMGINQLRYIDLKSGKIYYFENEPFGALSSPRDIQNQVTRMVIASDGNGYALTNNGKHLIRFTTGKNPQITDLGALTDDGKNAAYSVLSSGGYGGDMIADANKNLYLLTANRNVFKISIDNKQATYLGSIKGLPKGYTTNGAVVEGGSSVIVSSSQSTQGYYRFDLNTLQAEKISGDAQVFNASDLANGNLAFEKEKKKREKKDREVIQQPLLAETSNPEIPAPVEARKPATTETVTKNSVSVYPNPVTNGFVKLSFDNQPKGKYQVQFMDVSGKIISTQEVTINNRVQVAEFKLPEVMSSGNYLVKVTNAKNKVTIVNQLVVYK